MRARLALIAAVSLICAVLIAAATPGAVLLGAYALEELLFALQTVYVDPAGAAAALAVTLAIALFVAAVIAFVLVTARLADGIRRWIPQLTRENILIIGLGLLIVVAFLAVQALVTFGFFAY